MTALSPALAASDWATLLLADLADALALDIDLTSAPALTLLDEDQVEWTIEASTAMDQVVIHGPLTEVLQPPDPETLLTWLHWNARTALMRGAFVALHEPAHGLRLVHVCEAGYASRSRVLDQLSRLIPLRRHLISNN